MPTVGPTAPPTSGPAPTQAAARTEPGPDEPIVAAAPATEGAPVAAVDQQLSGLVVPPHSGTSAIRGVAFVDADADSKRSESEPGIAKVDVTLSASDGLSRTTRTADDGTFAFEGVAPGDYRVTVAVPIDYVPTSDAGLDVQLAQGADTEGLQFGLITKVAAGLVPGSANIVDPNADPSADDEQIIALASVSSLPLRFADGRDLMNQVQRRALGNGLVWLGVPFRTQIDGGEFQYVNCGPASLTMVLAGFGLEVGPSQVRDYLNNLIDNFDTDLGTSLDVLSRIGKEAGLTPMDLYSDAGGYRNWSTDAVRWHLQQGHPVITLVKYRNLPGHGKSLSEFDHYIVISGLTPNGFIYNDAAFATTLGYGLEISDLELEYAWENSSIPHHAMALGLSPDKKALSFPETPRKPRQAADTVVTPARNVRRLAESDEAVRAPLTLTPNLPTVPTLPVAEPVGPLIAERWQDDPDFQPLDASNGSPMGLNMESTDQPTVEARPGPGTVVPKLLVIVGSVWLWWLVWATSGRLGRRLADWRPRMTPIRAALSAILALTR
jgi:hypothetical protein